MQEYKNEEEFMAQRIEGNGGSGNSWLDQQFAKKKAREGGWGRPA